MSDKRYENFLNKINEIEADYILSRLATVDEILSNSDDFEEPIKCKECIYFTPWAKSGRWGHCKCTENNIDVCSQYSVLEYHTCLHAKRRDT